MPLFSKNIFCVYIFVFTLVFQKVFNLVRTLLGYACVEILTPHKYNKIFVRTTHHLNEVVTDMVSQLKTSLRRLSSALIGG